MSAIEVTVLCGLVHPGMFAGIRETHGERVGFLIEVDSGGIVLEKIIFGRVRGCFAPLAGLFGCGWSCLLDDLEGFRDVVSYQWWWVVAGFLLLGRRIGWAGQLGKCLACRGGPGFGICCFKGPRWVYCSFGCSSGGSLEFFMRKWVWSAGSGMDGNFGVWSIGGGDAFWWG